MKKRYVNMLGLKVPVKFIVDLTYNGQPCFGLYDPNTREIHLNPEQTPASLDRTFWHECGHAFLDRIGIRVALSEEIKEVIVEGFANFHHDNFYKKPKKRKKP